MLLLVYVYKVSLEAGESPALCRNGKSKIDKSDTAIPVMTFVPEQE